MILGYLQGLVYLPYPIYTFTYFFVQDLLREKNYRLSDLAESQLGVVRKEIEPEEVSAYYEKSDRYVVLRWVIWLVLTHI